MKCNAITVKGANCSKNAVSGNTMLVDGLVRYTCNSHYNKEGVTFYTGTLPVINKEDEMSEEAIAKEISDFEDGVEMRQTWEMEMKMTNRQLTFDEWMAEGQAMAAIRQISEDEVEWVRPFTNLTLITNYVNTTWKEGHIAKNTVLNGVGEVLGKDVYFGFVGHDGEQYVMVFDSRASDVPDFVVPMKQFKQQKKVAHLVVDLGNGKSKTFFSNRPDAITFARENNGRIFSALKPGFWVYVQGQK